MASRMTDLMVRAATLPLGNSGSPNGRRKLMKPYLGNQKPQPKNGTGGVMGGTASITYSSEGQPLTIDWNSEEQARQAYMGQVYVQRGLSLIADTIAQLPWVAGPDPTDPSNYDKDAALATLLGPSTPQAPGGPNPHTPARIFWAWSIVQYLVTGRFAWEVQYDTPRDKNIIGLWPLVSAALAPIPTMGGTEWFSGYQYTPARGIINYPKDKVIYCWKPSIIDFRLPESPLDSAQYPVYIANAINRYMANLLKNDLVATTLVVTPPIDEPDQRRAWEEQFQSNFTGITNTGKTIFAEVEYDEDDKSGKPLIQIERIAQTPMDAGLAAMLDEVKQDICIAMGVPRSLMGVAADTTFSNVDGEWRNFWTTTLLNLVTRIQDHVNSTLALRVDGGQNVGWFDLSGIEALQPSAIFTPPMITDAIQTGVATAEQIAAALGIPPDPNDTDAVPRDTDTDTVGRARPDTLMTRSVRSAIIKKYGQNTWTLRGERKQPQFEREHIRLRSAQALETRPAPRLSKKGIRQSQEIIRRSSELRAMAVADRTTAKVHQTLAKTYPESTLGWVDDADWSGPTQVDLADIDMARRPGGRDQAKVKGIAQAISDDPDGPAGAPVVLVKTPGSDKLKVADGYHRTLAHQRLEHGTCPAYIGTVDEEEGPWDSAMHDAKLNRQSEDDLMTRAMEDVEAFADDYVAMVDA